MNLKIRTGRFIEAKQKAIDDYMNWRTHSGIIFQLGYDSSHIGNPFSPLFYPHCSEYPAPFHLMYPRINNQNILDPPWHPITLGPAFDIFSNLEFFFNPISVGGAEASDAPL